MRVLSDGTVIPGHLRTRNDGDFEGADSFDNLRLRVGQVTAIIQPDDERSFSKRFIEYSVFVQERSGGTGAGRPYRCLLADRFGSPADSESFSLRADPATYDSQSKKPGKGAKVLILCVNGEVLNAVIIGGVRDQTTSDSKRAKGKAWYSWVFNGAGLSVDDDGQLSLSFAGKTKTDGSADDSADSNAAGSILTFTKKGSIEAKTHSGTESWVLDHENKKVAGKADKFTFDHQHGVKIGSATDKMLLGSTYRKAEQTMNEDLAVNFQSLQAALQSAAVALTTAGSSMGVPVVGAVAAAPQITLAGQFLNLAGTYMAQLQKAIKTFEGQSQGFLSKFNELD